MLIVRAVYFTAVDLPPLTECSNFVPGSNAAAAGWTSCREPSEHRRQILKSQAGQLSTHCKVSYRRRHDIIIIIIESEIALQNSCSMQLMSAIIGVHGGMRKGC